MGVSVLIPFRSTDTWRLAALTHIRRHYETHGWETVLGTCEGAWRKAAAVEDAYRRSNGDTLIVADADCLSDGTPAAVQAVEAGAPWAIPHRKVHRLTPEATEARYRGEDATRTVERPYEGKWGGGITVLPAHTWRDVPMDPRFTGWGHEDESWGFALCCLAGEPARFESPLWHYWHPPEPRMTRRVGSPEGRRLERRYFHARRAPDVMRALLEEANTCRTLST